MGKVHVKVIYRRSEQGQVKFRSCDSKCLKTYKDMIESQNFLWIELNKYRSQMVEKGLVHLDYPNLKIWLTGAVSYIILKMCVSNKID